MEKEVFRVKGRVCVIDACDSKEMTLDHIKAWNNKGRTSVSNLQPMCKSHNSSKSDTDFSTWLKESKLKLRQ
ncbi:HNH endonuclease signature motif containing protein [Dyella acidisoli]